MKIMLLFVTLICSISRMVGAASIPVEAKSLNMNAERFQIALSKIAPLEQWNASWSDRGPRICWKLFRPNPQQAASLMQIITSFHGHSQWYLVGDCLEAARAGIFVLAPPLEAGLASTPPATGISEADAVSDLAALANEIEKRLDLVSAQPMSFSTALLTKEGLQKSRGPFEDFEDGGVRIAYLITDPGSKVFEAKETDIRLHFEPTDDEMTAIFGDIVGVDLTQRQGKALTESEVEKISRGFPVLWKLSDYEGGAYLSPQEVSILLKECAALDTVVVSSKALRGLDKIYRIANWASEARYGVFFDAL